MMAVPCVILARNDQRYVGRHTRRRIFVGCRIRQSHEADERQSVARNKRHGRFAAVRTGASKVIFAATGKRIRRLPTRTHTPKKPIS